MVRSASSRGPPDARQGPRARRSSPRMPVLAAQRVQQDAQVSATLQRAIASVARETGVPAAEVAELVAPAVGIADAPAPWSTGATLTATGRGIHMKRAAHFEQPPAREALRALYDEVVAEDRRDVVVGLADVQLTPADHARPRRDRRPRRAVRPRRGARPRPPAAGDAVRAQDRRAGRHLARRQQRARAVGRGLEHVERLRGRPRAARAHRRDPGAGHAPHPPRRAGLGRPAGAGLRGRERTRTARSTRTRSRPPACGSSTGSAATCGRRSRTTASASASTSAPAT
jgi:hypothetical protein